MKNEFNALDHYISFIKTPEGVSVNQPELNARLDNISHLLTMYKKGTQKKITKHRKDKTTRNIQEGLPFTLEQMKLQYEDPNLVKKVSI